jgi:serine/threonine protein kinase
VPGQPAVLFHSTFRFCFAFIDFGSAVQFSPDATDHLITAEHMPPSRFAAPEQTQSEPYDIFASDVFNMGKVLQNELEEADRVCIHFSLLTYG